jgi:hypothetical protein
MYSFVSLKCCEMGPVAPAGNLGTGQLMKRDFDIASNVRRANCAIHNCSIVRRYSQLRECQLPLMIATKRAYSFLICYSSVPEHERSQSICTCRQLSGFSGSSSLKRMIFLTVVSW